MELKNSETKVNELRLLYESVRSRSAALGVELASLQIQENQLESELVESVGDAKKGTSANGILVDFETVRTSLEALNEKIEKFWKRRNEKDPVTQQPRYGQKTLTRVDALIKLFRDLQTAVSVSLNETNNYPDTTCTVLPIDYIRKRAEEEDEEKDLREREARRVLGLEEEARRLEEARLAEELRLAEEFKKSEEKRRRAENARLVEEARLARLREQEEAERIERAWIDGIEKGLNGVREQLNILVDSTNDDPLAQTSAVNALHTIFSQIVSRPEENNFRRIRRDHPKFMQGTCRKRRHFFLQGPFTHQ